MSSPVDIDALTPDQRRLVEALLRAERTERGAPAPARAADTHAAAARPGRAKKLRRDEA